jgi:hypothetical protein
MQLVSQLEERRYNIDLNIKALQLAKEHIPIIITVRLLSRTRKHRLQITIVILIIVVISIWTPYQNYKDDSDQNIICWWMKNVGNYSQLWYDINFGTIL